MLSGGVEPSGRAGFSPHKKSVFKKIFAFTLAETLIVMGIIGVVAALTIPNLNSSTADKEKVAKVKKLYANFEDAYGRATAVYGPFDEWFNGLNNKKDYTTRVGERFTEFMKVSKVCPVGTKGCVPTVGFNLDTNSSAISDDADGYSFILADGTSVAFYVDNTKYLITEVYIDGTKNRSVYPKNTFVNFFGIIDNQMYPSGFTPEEMNTVYEYNQYSQYTFMPECAVAWILQNDNMDYLKVLNTKGKCPNGKYLNWTTNTSCK